MSPPIVLDPIVLDPIVLDIDLDFIVRGTGTLREEPEKPVWCSADKLVARLRNAGLVSNSGSMAGVVSGFLDQQASLAVWEHRKLRGAAAIHIDAHRDVYCYQNQTAERCGPQTTSASCGDYLYIALQRGVIRETLQVVPDDIRLTDAARDVRRSCPAEIACRITLTRLDNLADAMRALGWRGPALITTIAVSPAWLPPRAWSEAQRVLDSLGIASSRKRVLHAEARRRWAELGCGGLPAKEVAGGAPG